MRGSIKAKQSTFLLFICITHILTSSAATKTCCSTPIISLQKILQNVQGQHFKLPLIGIIFDHLRSSRTRKEFEFIALHLRGGSQSNESQGSGSSGPPSDTIYVTGLPKFANEDWVAILFGFDKVKVDKESGGKQVYLYRDEGGVPTGAALVGLISVEEALRVQKECDGRALGEGGELINVRVVARKKGWVGPLPAGWQQFTDSRTGKPYYLDASTGRTQWERPTAPSGAPAPVGSGGPGGGGFETSGVTQSGRVVAGEAGGAELPRPAGPRIPGQRCVLTDKDARPPPYTGPLPRGSKSDMLLVDRKAHEAAAVIAPVYGDEGFVHCIGPCQCRCNGSCVGLCTCPRCEVYPGTKWPMHPEIFRLRQLGIPRTHEVYSRLKPPPGYVPGVGRGAVGFTLEQELGPSTDDYQSAFIRIKMLSRGGGRGRGRGRGRDDARPMSHGGPRRDDPHSGGHRPGRGRWSGTERGGADKHRYRDRASSVGGVGGGGAWEGQEDMEPMLDYLGDDGLLHPDPDLNP